jgi:hypothetical protein
VSPRFGESGGAIESDDGEFSCADFESAEDFGGFFVFFGEVEFGGEVGFGVMYCSGMVTPVISCPRPPFLLTNIRTTTLYNNETKTKPILNKPTHSQTGNPTRLGNALIAYGGWIQTPPR